MVAERTFHSIIQQIQCSNLNFQLQMSPFTANISLKKSPVTDKSCTPAPLSSNFLSTYTVTKENLELEKKLANALDECERSRQQLKTLVAQSSIKVEGGKALDYELNANKKLVNDLNIQIKQLLKENEQFENLVKSQSIQIKDLKTSNKTNKDVFDKVHKELVEIKVKFNKETKVIFREHKSEVKFGRKELGDERTMKIQLEEKI